MRILLISTEKREQTKNNFSSTSLSSKILIEIYEGKKGTFDLIQPSASSEEPSILF